MGPPGSVCPGADPLTGLPPPPFVRYSGGALSITGLSHVDTTSDLRYAKIYISALDKSQEKDMMKGLKSASGYLRRELGSALRLRAPKPSKEGW